MTFSIIIPVFNKELYIERCLQSVLDQSIDDFELIVVDDGSTDTSVDKITTFIDPRIRLIHKENGGASSARNVGIANSRGEWITFLDADDVMYPNALAVYHNLINKYPEVDVVAASVDQTNKSYPKQEIDYVVSDYDYSNAISYAKSGFSLICTDCICVKKSLLDKTGGFNECYTHGEDMDLWKRLSLETDIAKSDIPVALYDKDTVNNSSSVALVDQKWAPIVKLERPRSYFKTNSARLLQGAKVFYYTIPSAFKSADKHKLKILLRYLDWTTMFFFYVFYYRVIRRKNEQTRTV